MTSASRAGPTPNLEPKFDCVIVYVKDVDKSVEFYEKAFGLRERGRRSPENHVGGDGDRGYDAGVHSDHKRAGI